MIISQLKGGHSNQLFQYAVGRALADKHGTELLLDINWFEMHKDIAAPRPYELGVYPLKGQTTDMQSIAVIEPNQPLGKKTKLLKLLKPGKFVTMYREQSIAYDQAVLKLPDNTILDGYWQTEKYFKPLRKELLKELEPSAAPSKKNAVIIKQIEDTESVWLHVRRGDYATHAETNAMHGLKDVAYYEKALQTLLKKLPKSRHKHISLFVCSNDIAWCKKNLAFPYPITYVENQLGSDDMRVVKHCKHDILANSTFSWWGAWLNPNPNKIIIAPKQWFNDKTMNSTNDIVPRDWIRL